MTRFERQEEIYAKIQQIESALDQCTSDSPDYLPLRRWLNAALEEYISVPSDDVRRKEINSRLDQLQKSEPTQESLDEFAALCEELHSLSPSTKKWYDFNESNFYKPGFYVLIALFVLQLICIVYFVLFL